MSNLSAAPWAVHGIFQARILEWGALSFSMGSSRPRNQTHVSCFAGGFFTTKLPLYLALPLKGLKQKLPGLSHSIPLGSTFLCNFILDMCLIKWHRAGFCFVFLFSPESLIF